MKNSKIVLSVCLILAMLTSLIVFADAVTNNGPSLPDEPEPSASPSVTATPDASASPDPSTTPDSSATPEVTATPVPSPNIVLSADTTSVEAGKQITVDIVVSGITEAVKSGTVQIKPSTSIYLEVGSIQTVSTEEDENKITWTNIGPNVYSFELTSARTFKDGEVIGKIPLSGKGDIYDPVEKEAVSLVSVTMAGEAAENIPVVVDQTPVKVTVLAKKAAKVTLLSKINGLGDITVKFVNGQTEIPTTLTLSSSGKEIGVTTETKLDNTLTYKIVVTGAGYRTSTTEAKPEDGVLYFNVTDFYPGDMDGDGEITFKDFNDMCTKVYRNVKATDKPAYDLNKDGKVDKNDANLLVAGWKAGGAK